MSEITKEELMAFVEVQEKNAQQMEKIATSLSSIVTEQKEITKILSNGIAEKIVKGIKEGGCVDCKKGINDISKDVLWLKITIGSATLVTLIVYVILKIMGL